MLTTWLPREAIYLIFLAAVPAFLYDRDQAQLLANPKPPIPANGRVLTIQHDSQTMQRVADKAGMEASSFASSFDMYYEANLDGCDPEKNFVMISGTNGASYLYWDIIEHFRSNGYCTLNFDHRSHGRSEDAAGELTAELLGEDAAKIIQHVFPGKKVHVLGWSLGGAIAYYLGIKHQQLLASITVSGMASCFGGVLDDGSCDLSFDALKWFFSRDLMLRLLGTEIQGSAAVAAIKMHATEPNMRFFRMLQTATMTRTPVTWGRWDKVHYHEAIRQITAPVLLVAGEHEHLIGFNKASLAEDARRLRHAEPPQIFPGFSHFIFFEKWQGQSGLALVMSAIDAFHGKLSPPSMQ